MASAKNKFLTFLSKKHKNKEETEAPVCHDYDEIKIELSGHPQCFHSQNIAATGVSEASRGAFNWFLLLPEQELEQVEGVNGPTFQPSVLHVGAKVCVQWQPKGEEGAASNFAQFGPIEEDPQLAQVAAPLIEKGQICMVVQDQPLTVTAKHTSFNDVWATFPVTLEAVYHDNRQQLRVSSDSQLIEIQDDPAKLNLIAFICKHFNRSTSDSKPEGKAAVADDVPVDPMKSLQAKYQKVKKERGELQQLVSQLTGALEAASKKPNESKLQQEVRERDSIIEILRSQIESTKAELLSKQKKLLAAQTELESTKGINEDMKKQIAETAQSFINQQDLDRLRNQLVAKEKSNQELQHSAAALQAEVYQLRQQCDDFANENASLLSQLSSLAADQSQFEEHQKQLQEARQQWEQQSAQQLSEWQQQRAELEKSIAAIDREKSQLEKRVHLMQLKIAEKEEQLCLRQEEFKRTAADQTAVQEATLMELRKQLDESTAHANFWKRKFESLAKFIETNPLQQEQDDEKVSPVEHYQRKIEALEQENANLSASIQSLKHKLVATSGGKSKGKSQLAAENAELRQLSNSLMEVINDKEEALKQKKEVGRLLAEKLIQLESQLAQK